MGVEFVAQLQRKRNNSVTLRRPKRKLLGHLNRRFKVKKLFEDGLYVKVGKSRVLAGGKFVN